MSTETKYTGPLAPGMLFLAVGDAPAVRVVNVPSLYPGNDSDAIEVDAGVDEAGWFTVRCDDTEPYAQPDWTDPATVGALSGVVRSLYNEPTMHARPAHVDRISDAEPVIVWYIERAHEDDHEWLRESGAWGSMPDGHRDPPICCDTEHDAWLAAYHAHRDAAGTTANDIEVIRG